MLLVALTVLVFVAWYVFVSSETLDGPASGDPGGAAEAEPVSGAVLSLSTRIVLAGIGGSGQIVLLCLALGLVGLLTAGAAALASLLVAAGLLVPALRTRPSRTRLAAIVSEDVRRIPRAAREATGWETALFAAILLYTAIWLTVVVAYYPPRGIDDLVYHLPAVYQAAQVHRFEVLPLELRMFFAFPFNAEMPFLWIVLLTGSTSWVSAAQMVFAAFGIAAVYALGRRLALRPRGAFFAAALFGAMPVVLLQATSNYIDVIVNVWILSAAVALLAWSRSGSRMALFLAGLAAGLVLGSKYQSVLFVAALAGIACAAAFGRGLRGARLARAMALFAAPASAGLYWYVRNGLRYANPFYPLPVSFFGIPLFHGDWPQGPSAWSALLRDPAIALNIAAWDPGLRSFDGGLGFLFWGLGLAAWAWLLGSRLRAAPRAWGSTEVLILGLVPVGIVTFFLAPFETIAQTPRYVLSIGGVGFVALAAVIERASSSRTGASGVLRAAGIFGACLGLTAGPGSNEPSVTLAPIAAEPPTARALVKTHHLRYTWKPMAMMSYGWAPLDAMTLGGGGLTVYQATDYAVFWTAPTFGTALQNRIWNFLPAGDRSVEPEAYFFNAFTGAPLYVGKEVPRETIAADPRFELIAAAPEDTTTVYVSRSALAEKGRLARLTDYYRAVVPALLKDTVPVAEAVPHGEVLLATFPLAAAMLVHEADGRLFAQLVTVAQRDLQKEGARRADRAVYTLDIPIEGRKTEARELQILGRRHVLYRNEPAAGAGERGSEAAP